MHNKNTKKLDFSGHSIFIGLDVHKKSWTVTILTEDFEHKTFTQPPEPVLLYSYLNKNFPGATYYSVYEVGFSGYSHHYELQKLGINNIIVSAVDIPTTQKEKKQKRDPADSRKLAKMLRSNSLSPIFIPAIEEVELRGLSRYRIKLAMDIRAVKARIRSMLMFYGVSIPEEFDNSNWSDKFKHWITGCNLSDFSRD